MLVTKGTTNQSINIRIVDSTDGTPETGVVSDTSGIDMWYRREAAVSTDITEATLAALTTAHTDGGIKHINDGWYRLDVPDLAFATGVDGVQVGGTVTGMVVHAPYVQLTNFDLMEGVRGGLTSLPNAAADAAGGLPISDAGGLDIDAKLANTNEVTAARMGALTDWINGGRLDLLLDAIPTTAMRGTDSAALASVCTETRLAALTDWLNGGRLDLLLDAIPTTAMRGTDDAALASEVTAERMATLTDWINGGRLDLLLDAIPTTAMRGTDSAATEAKQDIIDTNVDDLKLGIIFGAAATGTLAIGSCTSDLSGFTNDQLIGRVIIFTAGPADGEGTDITDYASASGLLTFTDLTLAPEDGDTFKIV